MLSIWWFTLSFHTTYQVGKSFLKTSSGHNPFIKSVIYYIYRYIIQKQTVNEKKILIRQHTLENIHHIPQ